MTGLTYITYILSTIEVFIAVLAVIGNAFIIAIFFRDEKLQKRKTNFLFISQAFSDLFKGLIAIPLTVLLYIGQIREHISCIYTIAVLVAIRLVSINNIIAISFDRYKALSNPINYATNQSKSDIKIAISLAWFLGIASGSVIIFYNHKTDGDFFIFATHMTKEFLIALQFLSAIIPLPVLVALYASVYWMLRKHYLNHTCEYCTNVEGFIRDLCKIRKRESHATINMLAIVASFAVCKLPLMTLHFSQLVDGYSLNRDVLEAFVTFNHLNAMINPILYAFHLKDFRKSCVRIFNIKTNDEITSTSNKPSHAKHQNSVAVYQSVVNVQT